jgi:GH18 family chitinase
VSTVKFNIFNGNQWVSYDDEESFSAKKEYLSSRCLSGAIDEDDSNYDALSGLLGAEATTI